MLKLLFMLQKSDLASLREIDLLLYEELHEVNDFETELISLEHRLQADENIIARLHNACRTLTLAIKSFHTVNRKLLHDKTDKNVHHHKRILDLQLKHVENLINMILAELYELECDEKAGKKTAHYCQHVIIILTKKLDELQQKTYELEKHI